MSLPKKPTPESRGGGAGHFPSIRSTGLFLIGGDMAIDYII